MKSHRNEDNSKRRYPEQVCANPNCINGGFFEPHDRRQKYCEPQCRYNYHNDVKYEENATKYINEKKIRAIEKKLAKIYLRHVDVNGYCVVNKLIFYHEDIDVMLLVTELRSKETGGTIKWYYEYGIEIHPKDSNYYIIHKMSGNE